MATTITWAKKQPDNSNGNEYCLALLKDKSTNAFNVAGIYLLFYTLLAYLPYYYQFFTYRRHLLRYLRPICLPRCESILNE